MRFGIRWRYLSPLLLLVPLVALAAGGELEPAWGQMAIELLGGLALFLYGLELLSNGLKALAGTRLRVVLAGMTSNRIKAAISGALVTAVIQSSSVTTVLVVGFISAGLMSLSQSIGIIMGANVGTTITAQIIAFKVTKLALLLIAVGFLFLFVSRREQLRQAGNVVMGLGLVFLGMGMMSDAMSPLRSYQPFLDLMIHLDKPLLSILLATAFTALVQSSSATTGIVIVMASQGFITLESGIALAFGANLGTCVTALLAAIGKPRAAVRAALVHVVFNVFGVILWFFFIDALADLVALFSPQHPELAGATRLAAETPRQIANAHTVFNLVNTLLFIGFTDQFARLVEWLVPDRPEKDTRIRPLYLDEGLIATPALALERVRMEMGRMGEQVKEMLRRILPAMLNGDREALLAIRHMDNMVDQLYGHVIRYLGSISRQNLAEEQSAELLALMKGVGELENIGDLIETNLVELGLRRVEQELAISASTRQWIRDYHSTVSEALDGALLAVTSADPDAAKTVIRMKKRINQLHDSVAVHQAQRLVAEEPNRIQAYTLEVEIVEKLKRMYYFCKRLARGAAMRNSQRP